MYCGSWNIDDFLTFSLTTRAPDGTGVADADSAPAYRIYEDETGTAILTGTMAKLDDANTTGFYTERVQLSAANGLENNKTYTIYIEATVDGTDDVISHTFQVRSAVATASALATVDANVDAILVDTGTSIPADIAGLNNFNPATDTVATVTTVTNMRGTDNALLAASYTAPDNAGISAIEVDTQNIQSRLPATLVSGRINASVGAMAANTLTASAIAANAIGASELAADAVTEIQSGLATASALATVDGIVDAILIDTNELQLNQGDWATATGFATSGALATVDSNVDAILVDTGTTLPATLTSMSGATFNASTDSLEAIRNRGDAAWTTATGFSTFNPATDTVANVTLVDTVTTNSDMRGTDGANTVVPDNASITAILADTNELQLNQGDWATATGFATSGALATVDANVDAILVDTNTTIPNQIAALNNISAADVLNATIENSLSLAACIRLQNSAMLGKVSGGATTTNTFRNLADNKDRITATVDADGNRTAVTLDGT